MAPFNWEIVLTGFRFPAGLPPKRANFRFLVDLRYVTKRGEHTTEHAVLPAIERWWECDPGKRGELDYVRGPETGAQVEFDFARIDDWDRLVLLVRGDAIHSVQFQVFDVDRPGVLDRIRSGLGDVLGALVGRARGALPGVAGVFSDSLGSAATDLESALLARLAGADRLLFRGSSPLPEPGEYAIEGDGEAGRYRVEFSLRSV
jgi:hypothetical protein